MIFSKYDTVNADIVDRISEFAMWAESLPTYPATYVLSETRIGHISYGDRITVVVVFDGTVARDVGEDLVKHAQNLGLLLSIRESRQFNPSAYDGHCAMYRSFTNTWRRWT